MERCEGARPPPPFVIFALPRSRTAWLSRFLSCGGWHCGHDELRHLRTLDDVGAWFSQPFTGTVETAAAPWWRLLKRYAPEARVVVVRRPVGEVVESLMRLEGLTFDRARLTANMQMLDRKLGQIIRRVPGAISVDYAGLTQEATCAALFEHCLSLPHDRVRWAAFAAVNTQIDMVAMMRYAEAYRPALMRLGNSAKQQILAGMMGRQPVLPSGVTIETESFDDWFRDAEALFKEHCISVGEPPDQWKRKNVPLIRQLYEIGAIQFMAARSNGRMFGYLMTIIAPSLTAENVTSATNTLFFASPEFPGLGMKLQRAAIRALRDRGVDDVFFEAGKRGSGERLGAMYRRLGAVDHGHVLRMQLTGT